MGSGCSKRSQISPLGRDSADRLQERSKNVYSRWYEKLKRFYQGLPTVYNEDTSTPSLPFNNLVTVERRRFGAKKDKDISEFLKASIHGIDSYVKQAKKIEYKEILCCKEVTTGKRGIISGAPGCGKTTLSRKLCQDLYLQVLPNKYKMILLVELRKLKTSLKEMKEDIDLQFLLRGAGVSNLSQLCETMEESDGEGVAMILDGFDEVADYLGKSPFLRSLLSVEEPYLSACDMFVTTRPSCCPDLISLMRQPSCHVEILGFTDSDIDGYVQGFFSEASSDKVEVEQKSKVVIDKLNSLPVIRGMSRIPLVLKIICKVQDHLGSAPLPDTVSGIFSLYICHQLVEYLVWASQCTGAPISDVLKIPTDTFPGFYPLCKIAYKCCSDKKGQRLILTEEDVKEVEKYIDKRGSIYNLLFSERVDETSPVAGFVYQFNHKTVQETLAAIHIAHQREEDQQRIWSEDFACPGMGEIWKLYCGLTGLRFVDLTVLGQSGLWQRARDIGAYTQEVDKLIMVSLFEGGNSSLSVRILPTLIGKSLTFHLKSPYDVHVLVSTLCHHPSLEELVLWSGYSHPGVECLTRSISQHRSLRKLTLLDFHQSGFEEFRRNFKVRHNLKSIVLWDAPVNIVLTVVASGIKELKLKLSFLGMQYNLEEWKAIQHALDTSCALVSFHIEFYELGTPLPFSLIEHLSLKKTFVNLSIAILSILDKYSELPLSCLRSLLGPREKCHVMIKLTRQQWCAVLSGLKEAKALKELNVNMMLPSFSELACKGDYSPILSTCELEELVATSKQLVKVDVTCDEKLSDLMLAIVKGVARNQNVSQLGIDYPGHSKGTMSSLVDTLAHAHHISHLKWKSRGVSPAVALGPNWCQLVIDGLMHRRVCHLVLWLSVAESIEILSRVDQAEQLEELSLAILDSDDDEDFAFDCIDDGNFQFDDEDLKFAFDYLDDGDTDDGDTDDRDIDDDDIDDEDIDDGGISNGDINDAVVKRIEEVWSMCALKKVDLSICRCALLTLLGAVLRGVAVNGNNVDFVLEGKSHYLSKDDLVSQLGQEKVESFKVIESEGWVYFISCPLDSTCSSGSDGRPLEETQDKDGGLLQSTTDNKSSSGSDGRPLEETQDKDGGLLQSTADNKKSVLGPVSSEMPSPEVGPVNPPSPQGPPGSTDIVQGPVIPKVPSPEVGPVNPPSPQGPPDEEFDSEAFMNRFSERFLKSVDSHAIVTRLEIDYIISDTLAHTIKHTTVNSGNEELLLYLRKYADVKSIGKLCDVMISKDGYRSMQKLGQDMKEDLAKFTGKRTEH